MTMIFYIPSHMTPLPITIPFLFSVLISSVNSLDVPRTSINRKTRVNYFGKFNTTQHDEVDFKSPLLNFYIFNLRLLICFVSHTRLQPPWSWSKTTFRNPSTVLNPYYMQKVSVCCIGHYLSRRPVSIWDTQCALRKESFVTLMQVEPTTFSVGSVKGKKLIELYYFPIVYSPLYFFLF